MAAVVSAVLTYAIDLQKGAATARAQLRGILLELNHAERCSIAYRQDSATRPWAPGYRIVTEFLRSGIMALAAAGALRGAEAEHLHQLYIDADEANRSLELLAHYVAAPMPDPRQMGLAGVPLLMKETSRARMKFENVLKALLAARTAAKNALDPLTWFEPQD